MPYHAITSTCWLALESNKGVGYRDPQFCCLSQMASPSTPDGNRATDPHNTLQLVHHQCQYPRLSGQGLAYGDHLWSHVPSWGPGKCFNNQVGGDVFSIIFHNNQTSERCCSQFPLERLATTCNFCSDFRKASVMYFFRPSSTWRGGRQKPKDKLEGRLRMT